MTETLIIIVVAVCLFFIIVKVIEKNSKEDQNNIKTASHLPEKFAVVDIETTGLDETKDKITEIAAIKVRRGTNTHNYLTSFINPRIPIPYEVSLKTGITNDMVKDEKPVEEVLGDFLDFFEDYPLAFYNADFDLKFLRRDAQKINREINNEIIDVYSICKMAFPKTRNYKLTTIAERFNIDTKGAHRALDDCKITLQVFTRAAYIVKHGI
jgi:DNA polymerase-3 subunit alpha (Gram-positive type)